MLLERTRTLAALDVSEMGMGSEGTMHATPVGPEVKDVCFIVGFSLCVIQVEHYQPCCYFQQVAVLS